MTTLEATKHAHRHALCVYRVSRRQIPRAQHTEPRQLTTLSSINATLDVTRVFPETEPSREIVLYAAAARYTSTQDPTGNTMTTAAEKHTAC